MRLLWLVVEGHGLEKTGRQLGGKRRLKLLCRRRLGLLLDLLLLKPGQRGICCRGGGWPNLGDEVGESSRGLLLRRRLQLQFLWMEQKNICLLLRNLHLSNPIQYIPIPLLTTLKYKEVFPFLPLQPPAVGPSPPVVASAPPPSASSVSASVRASTRPLAGPNGIPVRGTPHPAGANCSRPMASSPPVRRPRHGSRSGPAHSGTLASTGWAACESHVQPGCSEVDGRING
jgi:hypothetical protein